MIAAAIRRTLVDLWDNAVAVFALNLALLCVTAILLYLVSRAVHWPPLLFVAALLAALMAALVLLSASAALIRQIAARSDIDPRAFVPDLRFCALVTLTLAGTIGSAVLLMGAASPATAFGVAAMIAGLWAAAVAVQLVVLTPALALDRELSAVAKLGWLAMLVLRFPLATIALAVLAGLSLAATVGLLPGPAGAAYLFLRAGRVLRVHLTSLQSPADEAVAVRQAAVGAELRPLKNRTPRNLLQPWRASS